MAMDIRTYGGNGKRSNTSYPSSDEDDESFDAGTDVESEDSSDGNSNASSDDANSLVEMTDESSITKRFQFFLNTLTISWNIPDFKAKKVRLDSPYFSSPIHVDKRFRLMLYPNGDVPESRDHISVYLNAYFTDGDEQQVFYDIKIDTDDWDEVTENTFQNGSSHGFSTLKPLEHQNLFIKPDGSMVIQCKIEFPEHRSIIQLSKDMRRLFMADCDPGLKGSILRIYPFDPSSEIHCDAFLFPVSDPYSDSRFP